MLVLENVSFVVRYPELLERLYAFLAKALTGMMLLLIPGNVLAIPPIDVAPDGAQRNVFRQFSTKMSPRRGWRHIGFGSYTVAGVADAEPPGYRSEPSGVREARNSPEAPFGALSL